MSQYPPPRPLRPTTISYSDVDYVQRIQLKDAVTRSLMAEIFLDSMFHVEDSMEPRLLFFCDSVGPALIKKISGEYGIDISFVGLSENG